MEKNLEAILAYRSGDLCSQLIRSADRFRFEAKQQPTIQLPLKL